MKLDNWLLLLIMFALGFGWGQVYFHFKNRYNQRGRIIVSMPMNP